MKGKVLEHHILLNVVFVLPSRRQVAIEMVVDTGYVGTLTLPPQLVQAMALPFLRNMTATLADGSSIDIDVHSATIFWHGLERNTEVIVLDDRSLLGMVLMDGSRLDVQLVNGAMCELTEVS